MKFKNNLVFVPLVFLTLSGLLPVSFSVASEPASGGIDLSRLHLY
jgi:hypothetical protein